MVVAPGNTWRLPDAFTEPIPGSMVMFVVLPDTAHRSVAAWPRSTVDGSASNVETVGACGLGGGVSLTTGGGGGGATATFFLHPTANKLNVSASVTVPMLFRLAIL